MYSDIYSYTINIFTLGRSHVMVLRFRYILALCSGDNSSSSFASVDADVSILYNRADTATQNILAKNSTTKSGLTKTSTTRTMELNGKK